ncbi:MAG: Tm-1-like ATP-binding domain-containing protein, partial [Burkholderiaceae bacterium]|nr:Tm-1-like ATP-binding domain-containing protein [Burkholderiaceae bacterium]
AGLGERLCAATGPTALLLPRRGIHAWDLPGEPMHDPEGHRAFMDAMRDAAPPNVDVRDLDLHINDAAFSDAVLAIFDNWRALGHVPPACAKA